MKLPTLTGTKIDGIQVAKNVKHEVTQIVESLKSHDVIPCLATVLVGDNSASQTYVKNKHIACEETGIITKDHRPPVETSQNELNELIDMLNEDSSVHGILVQLPLPNHLNEFDAITRIFPEKDVDGLTPHNIGLLVTGKAVLKPCTPSGIIEMLDYYKISLEAKNVVVINRSNLVGKPLYHLLLQKNATVTTCHSKTKDLDKICQKADIVITGVGDRDNFTLTSDMIKDGASVIDVATTHHDGKLKGDTDFDDIISKASFA